MKRGIPTLFAYACIILGLVCVLMAGWLHTSWKPLEEVLVVSGELAAQSLDHTSDAIDHVAFASDHARAAVNQSAGFLVQSSTGLKRTAGLLDIPLFDFRPLASSAEKLDQSAGALFSVGIELSRVSEFIGLTSIDLHAVSKDTQSLAEETRATTEASVRALNTLFFALELLLALLGLLLFIAGITILKGGTWTK